MSKPSRNNESKKEVVWTPEDINKLVETIHAWYGEYMQYQKDRDSSLGYRLGALSHHNRRLSYALMIFLGAVVGMMVVLTYLGKVSGDALLFLVGTITGYVVVMIQDLIGPIFEPTPPEAK
jgi:hypothetical protein